MTSQRSQAYGRVMKTLSDLSASKFHAREQDIVRHAVDRVFFCEDLAGDPDAREALAAVRTLADEMVASDRLLPETAERLVGDVDACGPMAPVAPLPGSR